MIQHVHSPFQHSPDSHSRPQSHKKTLPLISHARALAPSDPSIAPDDGALDVENDSSRAAGRAQSAHPVCSSRSCEAGIEDGVADLWSCLCAGGDGIS